MKYLIATILSLLVLLNISAQTMKATTENGKSVILNENGTWEYDESEKADYSKFVEPKGDPKNQAFLERTGATVQDLKNHVSVDTDCPIDKIVLLNLSEQLGNAIYVLDVCGTKMKYRRTGSVFFKDGEEPYKAK